MICSSCSSFGTVLVIGASRGIGLELVKQYAAAGWNTHATVRSMAPGNFPPTVVVHTLDVTSAEQTAAIADALSNTPIDLVIHNAGIRRAGTRAEIEAVNVNGPMNSIAALLPVVMASSQKKLCLISSQLGSRERFGGGQVPSDDYGWSKCMLNDRFRAAEGGWRSRGIASTILHPGWVRTDMGGTSAPTTVEESAAGIKRVCDDLNLENSGRFLTFEGIVHPW